MKLQRTFDFAAFYGLVLLCVMATAGKSFSMGNGPLQTPLRIYTRQMIFDERGLPLKGASDIQGDCIQVLTASGGVIYPPSSNGAHHPENFPHIAENFGIGLGTDPALQASGRFSIGLANEKRPAEGTKIFVRIFNDPNPSNATFYADSRIFTVTGNERFIVDIEATTNALDSADDDGDRLINSWEASYGTDSILSSDFDHDGMSDYAEHRAGTSPTDAHSRLAVYTARTSDGRNLLLQWTSVPGKQYQIECSQDDLGTDMEFQPTGPVITATEETSEYVIPCGTDVSQCVYRIKLVE